MRNGSLLKPFLPPKSQTIIGRFSSKRFISLRNEMSARLDAVNTRIDSLEKHIPVIEEIAKIKIRLNELEKKVS